ncbi:MAG: hypothetical protein GF421_06645 [Candidatus Aminicenantes bacterium]|nr:hypothetical protein [Candidatus Aminicenantes bacterium]
MKTYRISLLLLILVFFVSSCAQPKSDFDPYLRLLEKALDLDQSKFNKIWPDYNLNNFPIGLYNENEAYLINHPSPGDLFQKTNRKIHNYVLYHSPKKPDGFFGNTSLEYNGHRISIFMIDQDMSEDSFYNLLFHEVFHSFQRDQEIFDKRFGNVILQPFFPLDDLEFYTLSYIEQMILKDAYLSDKDEQARKKAQQYYMLSEKRNSMLDEKFIEFESNVHINEGIATYAGNKGLEIMGFPESSKQNLFKLINEKIDVPTGFRLRCYSMGRSLAELLDRFSPDWQTNLQPGFTLDEVLRSVVEPLYDVKLKDILKKYHYEEVRNEFKTLLVQQAKKREQQKKDILKPGYMVIQFPSLNFLDMSSMRFDPMNISLVEEQLLCHKSLLILGKKDRFQFKLNWQPILTEIAPGNLFMISKIYFTVPEDAQMTVNGETVSELDDNPDINEFILESKSIQLEIREAWITREDSHSVIELK